MTTYQIAAPDGKTYEIEGPPGASQEQVKAEVLRQNPYAASTTEQLKAAPVVPFSAKDVGAAGASAVVGGLGSLASIFGAEIAPAKYLREKQESLQREISPDRQEEIQRRGEISKRAESLGLGEQISSGIAGVVEAPLQGLAQGLGSSVVPIAAALIASVASAPVAIAAGVGLTARLIFGALQGVGETKSSIYERVKSELEKSGKSPAEAEAEAIKSQEYLNTKNIPGLAAGAAVGMLDMVTGVEKYVPKAFLKPKVPTGLGALPTKPLTAPTKIGMTARSTLEEMVPEGIQGGTGQAVENLALTNAGIETPLMQGVAGAAARDAVIGGLTGAAISPVSYKGEKREFEAKKQAQDIQKAAADYAQQEKTKEQLGVPELLALPAPPKRTITPPVVNELINPLGDVTRDELNPDVAKYIDEYRQENGLPRLQSFSIEDVKNAMTQKNPEGEKAALDSIVAAKSGFTGEQAYSPQDVLNAAEEKNISVGTKGFNDFLGRTTGTNDLNALSQPQLYAAFKALKAMQAAPEPTVLPEGSNATTFTQSQYNNAVGILQAQPRSVTELMPLIKAATGIKEDRDARAIIDTAAKNDVITLEKVGEIEQATPSKPVEPAKVRAQLPAGYEIREEEFQEGEGPAKYDIYTPDNKVLGSAPDQAAAQEKVTRLQELRTKRAEQMDANVKKAEDQIAKSQEKLDKMEADGKVGTEIYQKLQAAQPGKVRVLNARIATFKQAKEGFLVPLAFKPVGKKIKARKGHTVYQDGKSTVTLPTRAAAEEHVLANLPDEELAKVASDTRFGGITNRAAKEQNRRTSAPEGIAVKTTTGTDEGLVRAGVTVKGRSAQATEVGNKLRAALDKFGLNEVALKVVAAIENNAEGSYAAKLIQVALNVDNPIRIMRHEAFHALKELGFFTPQQYAVLENQAKKSWINKYLKGNNVELDGKIMSRYDGYVYINQTEPNNWNQANPNKSPKAVLNDQQMQELLIEEAIADAFGDFDVNGAPPGMLTALLNKLRSLFTALQNALTGAGFQTYEDIFGKVERGEMKATKAEAKAAPKMSLAESTDAWKADKQTIQNAEEYEKENGIRPYVSEGFIDLPKDGTKYSLQAFNPDKHLSYDAVLGVPINRDGTITLYYHTTKENAVNISNKKVIPSEGRNRVYLTNESVGADVLRNRGNFDQDLDGSTVLVYAHPELLQMDMEHSNGRKDFYIPVAQGDFFNKKMKLQSIQKSRTSAITDVFSYKDHEAKIADAVQSYKSATAAERRQLVSSARKLLKQEHNVSSLLSENGKLEKTRVNEYDLDWDGNSVASMGLGLASAQQISDKVSTCPRSAICEGLCLGETSGGNLMFGGAASEDVNDIQKSSFRAAARMMQYLKTEALVIHPKEFATLLQAEIDSLNKWCASETQIKVNKETNKRYNEAKEIYQPAVRLNVTSDFKPSMFRAIIEENPNIEFYDYTKLGSESIAKNHHLTYSSTGFGQVVDGEKVFFKDRAGNYDHNWATMRSRLNNGKNVAMAFSSKSGIPLFLNDEETGNTYRVWNGDDYDARFLDPKQPDGKGMIIGLKNKAGTLSEKTATKKTGGFFVKYDPKTDGETVVVPDQQQFQTKLAKKTIPIKQEKLSLRAPTTPEFKRWFGNSKIVDKDGNPKVMYHGTARDISEFRPHQAGAIFVTDNPDTAERYTQQSIQWLSDQAPKTLNTRQMAEAVSIAKSLAKANGYTAKQISALVADKSFYKTDEFREAVTNFMDEGPNILPLYIRAENPFDYDNPDHVKAVMDKVPSVKKESFARTNNWNTVEGPDVLAAIKELGFDAFYVSENGDKNLAVFQPTQVKSAIGNRGTYDINNPDIRYSLREFKKSDLPKNKKEYTLPEDTLLYHGSHETRAKEIEAAGKILIPRSPIKTSGGSTDEGGLVFFGNKETATQYANSEADPLAVQFAEEQGENRQPGVVFETATDRPYRLMSKDYVLTQQQADDLNKVLGIPDYKLLRKGDTADTAAFRAVTNSRTVDRYKTDKGKMVVAWPKIFDTLGYDGYYDDFAVALTADNGIRLVGKGGKMERFSLRNQINAMPNGAAINASIDRITPGREVKGFVQRITQALSGDTVSMLRAAFLNRYNRLSEYDKKLAEKMGGAALLANSSAEAAALHSDLGAGLTAAAFGVHDKVGGIPVFKNGMTTVSNQNGTVKGPLAIFYDLAAMGDPRAYQMYQFWAGAKRGTRFLANGTEENYTQKELDEAKELGIKYPQFEKIQKEWIKYNNGLVKFMVDTGVVSAKGAAEMIKYGDYIPFYRQLEGETTVGPNIFQSIGGVRAPKKYKGGTEAPLADFLETIVRNTQASIQAGIKNVAAERAKNVAVELGQATRLNAPSSAPSVFTVLEKGEKVYYDSADKLFIDAISALNIADLPFIGILSAPANALRNLVTKDPGFMMVNLMRDSMSAWVTSGAKMTPIASTVANYGRAIAGTSPTFTALLNAGVLGGYDYSRGVEQSGQALAKQLRKVSGTQTTAEKAAMPFTGVWDALEKGSMASDAATRMSVYDATLKATGNDVEALHRALEVMNFNRKGSSAVIRILTAAIPFLNARMQGLDILYRAGFGQMATADAAAIQKAFLIRGLTIMGLTALYYAMTHDDDEYKKQEQETRDNNWLIPSLGIRIPIPFEVGTIFKVIPERIMALAFGSDTGKDFLKSMGRQVVSTFGVNPVPQVALPIVESVTNFSFFTFRPVIGRNVEGLDPRYQVGPSTSNMAKMVGENLNMSPMVIDHLVGGYTGTMGMYAVQALDTIMDLNNDSPKASKRFNQLPVIKRFAIDPEARGTVTGYYDLKNSVDEVVRTTNYLERTGNMADMAKYQQDNMRVLATQGYIKSLNKTMDDFQKIRTMIQGSSMSADAKRDALLNITKAQNQLTSNIQTIRVFAQK